MTTTIRRRITHVCQIAVTCVVLAGLDLLPLRSGDAGEAPDKVAEELRQLRIRVEEQGKQIERIYRAVEPHLAALEEQAERLRQQKEEDTALALERVANVSDEGLSSLGCANPTAAEFAIIEGDGGLRIFDAHGKTGKRLRSPGQRFTALAYSPNGTELLTGTDDGALLVWDLAKGVSFTASASVGGKVDRVTWMGNDRLVWGGRVRYRDDSGKPTNHDKPAGAVLARDSGEVLWQYRSYIRDDYFTLTGALDGQRLVVLEIPGQPRGAFLLDGATGEVLTTCFDKEHGSGPLSVGISPDGRTLAVGYAPCDVILWDARTGERQKLLKGHGNWVVSLAFSSDSKRLISGAGDSTARIWDVESGKEIGRIRFKGESTYVHSVGLSPKGDVAFALTQGGYLVVAKVPTGNP
jgi:WD40 repeat protein